MSILVSDKYLKMDIAANSRTCFETCLDQNPDANAENQSQGECLSQGREESEEGCSQKKMQIATVSAE